jgi:hypothetical protein
MAKDPEDYVTGELDLSVHEDQVEVEVPVNDMVKLNASLNKDGETFVRITINKTF